MFGLSLQGLVYALLVAGVALALGVVLLLVAMMLRVRRLRRRGATARRSAEQLAECARRCETLRRRADLAGDRRTLGLAVARSVPSLEPGPRERVTQWLRDEGYVGRWMADMRSRRPWQRATAASLLGDARATEATPELERALRARDSAVRASAALALADMAGPAALPALVRVVADGVLPDRVALAALKGMGPEAADDVAELLWHQSPLVRRVAAAAVAHRGDRASASAVLARALDGDVEVRRRVISALFVVDGHLDPVRMRRMLERGAHDEAPTVRAAAATAIGALLRQDGEPLLRELTHDRDFWVVARARNAITAVEGRATEGYSTLPPDAPWPVEHAARMAEAMGDAQARDVAAP